MLVCDYKPVEVQGTKYCDTKQPVTPLVDSNQVVNSSQQLLSRTQNFANGQKCPTLSSVSNLAPLSANESQMQYVTTPRA